MNGRIAALALLLVLAPACRQAEAPEAGPGRRGPELPVEEVARREAPFEAGLELLAAEIAVALSRNYHQDPSLLLPAGAGELQRARRTEHGWAWQGAPGVVLPLDFHFRRFKAKALDRLVVEFPPVQEFSLGLVARGQVFLVLPDGRELRGAEFVIQGGRTLLDGRELDLAAWGSPP